MTPAEPHTNQGGAVYRVAKSDVDALIADVKSECDQMHTSGNMGIHSWCIKWLRCKNMLNTIGTDFGGGWSALWREIVVIPSWTVLNCCKNSLCCSICWIYPDRWDKGPRWWPELGHGRGDVWGFGGAGVIGSATLEASAHNTTCAIRPWAKTNSVTIWTTIRYKSLLHCAAMWTKELSKGKTLLSKKPFH